MRKLEKLLPKLKTRMAEVKFIDRVAEGVWIDNQRRFSGRIPADIPKWGELTNLQKLPTMLSIERVLLQLQKMRVRFK